MNASRELDVAIKLARAAGLLVSKELGKADQVDYKASVNLVTDVDRQAENLIIAGLRESFPNDAIVAEESAGEKSNTSRVWYIDPIDGTTNFVHGLPHCSVSIAMAEDGEMQRAVVYDPCKDELFHAERNAGAFLNGQPIRPSERDLLGESLWVTGFPYDRRSHLKFYLSYFEAFIVNARDVRRFGSAALDLCYVAAGRFDGFWEWKLSPWDTAAGWLIVEEAGGRVSNFAGARYDPWGPQILATNGKLHRSAMDLLATLPDAPLPKPSDREPR